jgi:hypothetical protein
MGVTSMKQLKEEFTGNIERQLAQKPGETTASAVLKGTD